MAVLQKPDLVFRLGFAGNRYLPQERLEALSEILATIYETIGTRLKEIAPGVPHEGKAAKITRFYSNHAPLLRVVTGLAEGADALASQVLLELPNDEHLNVEVAAILPFDQETYRNSREESFRASFDDLCNHCSYILQLDGIYDKPDPDTNLARHRRARAYRAQSTLLLRHSDVMVVIADSSGEGRPGGSLETINRALGFEIPVLLIDSHTLQIRCIEPDSDLEEQLVTAPHYDVSDSKLTETIGQWITVLVADPDTDPAQTPDVVHELHQGATATGEQLLSEFFAADSVTPPRNTDGSRQASLRERCWTWFHNRFKPTNVKEVVADKPLQPLAAFRQRAAELNYHYAGMYRGTFVLNYLFAVLAVTLATFSLLVMGEQHTAVVHDMAEAVQSDHPREHDVESESHNGHAPDAAQKGEHDPCPDDTKSFNGLLLGLALIKLSLVYAIYRNTHKANHGHWNDKAIDCRYLAERLRASYYLPLVGSFQPPAASQPQFASRVLRQSSIDWLFDAIIRSVSPADIEELGKTSGDETASTTRLLLVAPEQALQTIRDSWLAGQIAYHSNNKSTMHQMNQTTDRCGRWLNVTVIGVVVIDIAITVGYLLHVFPHWLHELAPVLVFSAAVLPAAVAGLNGIRFQSECRRLADRSHVMQRFLERSQSRAESLAEKITQQTNDAESNLGSWTPDVLRLAETIACDMVEEVAEWSVVYAKELPEP